MSLADAAVAAVLSLHETDEPDFAPDGSIGDAGLVSPEATLTTSPITIALLNGLHSLIDLGHTYCYGGFADRQYADFNGGELFASINHLFLDQ